MEKILNALITDQNEHIRILYEVLAQASQMIKERDEEIRLLNLMLEQQRQLQK